MKSEYKKRESCIMKKTKKALALILAGMMAASMTACGSGKTAETTRQQQTPLQAESATKQRQKLLQMALLIKLVSASWYSM